MQARGNQANDSASGILAAHQILDASGVQYWLDSGSLLGLIREGQEIAWDSDIDLGIWESQVPKAFKILKDLRSQGYRVSWRSYRGLTYGFSVEADKKDLLRPIHIHVYFKHGHIAWSPQTVAYQQISRANANIGFALWPRTRKALLYLRDMARTRQTGSTAQKLWKYGFCYPAWGSLVMLRNRLDRQLWSSLWPFSTIYTIYTW
ncbi:MAG: LicD family protein, partial [Desulfohalobiaceae bacterium]